MSAVARFERIFGASPWRRSGGLRLSDAGAGAYAAAHCLGGAARTVADSYAWPESSSRPQREGKQAHREWSTACSIRRDRRHPAGRLPGRRPGSRSPRARLQGRLEHVGEVARRRARTQCRSSAAPRSCASTCSLQSSKSPRASRSASARCSCAPSAADGPRARRRAAGDRGSPGSEAAAAAHPSEGRHLHAPGDAPANTPSASRASCPLPTTRCAAHRSFCALVGQRS